MFKFTVRAAKPDDEERVYKICVGMLNTEVSRESFTRLYNEIIEDIDQIVLLAVHSGNVVGFIHARRQPDITIGYYTEISAIALTEYFQKRGGGTKLVLGAEFWSTQMLTFRIRCRLTRDNQGMRALLIGCGYYETCFGVFEKHIN